MLPVKGHISEHLLHLVQRTNQAHHLEGKTGSACYVQIGWGLKVVKLPTQALYNICALTPDPKESKWSHLNAWKSKHQKVKSV